MNIEQLRTVLELNRTRHFRLAAEALFITQSTVTARIKSLEDELGVRLFEREPRNLKPTPEGQSLLRHAESILAIWRRAQQDIAMAREARQQLAVGGLFSLWDLLLQDWLGELHGTMPQLALAAETHDHAYLMRQLLNGALDLIFVYDPPRLEEVLCVEVAPVPLWMIAGEPGLGVAEALARDYIMVDWGETFRLEHKRLFPDAPDPVRRVNQASLALRFILSGGGCAYLAEQMVAAQLEQNQLHRVVKAPVILRRAYAVYLRRSANLELIMRTLTYFPENGGRQNARP